MIPDLVLVPLLCFDSLGMRLGYGGGYFDQTIKYYRKHHIGTQFVGVGLEMLKVERVPHDDLDEPLDFVVTEEGVYNASNNEFEGNR